MPEPRPPLPSLLRSRPEQPFQAAPPHTTMVSRCLFPLDFQPPILEALTYCTYAWDYLPVSGLLMFSSTCVSGRAHLHSEARRVGSLSWFLGLRMKWVILSGNPYSMIIANGPCYCQRPGCSTHLPFGESALRRQLQVFSGWEYSNGSKWQWEFTHILQGCQLLNVVDFREPIFPFHVGPHLSHQMWFVCHPFCGYALMDLLCWAGISPKSSIVVWATTENPER